LVTGFTYFSREKHFVSGQATSSFAVATVFAYELFAYEYRDKTMVADYGAAGNLLPMRPQPRSGGYPYTLSDTMPALVQSCTAKVLQKSRHREWTLLFVKLAFDCTHGVGFVHTFCSL
jgi:hypothetical protein